MKTLFRLMLITCLVLPFAACKKAEAPKAEKPTVAMPTDPANKQGWMEYMGDVVTRNMDGVSNPNPYAYLLPAESAADFQEHARLAGVDQQQRLVEQALFVQARRAGECRQAGQQAQVVLAEHALKALLRHCGEAATGEFGQAIEVQQLALREQHHERTDGVVEQHRLDLALGIQAGVFKHFGVADAQLAEQQPDNRRRVRSFASESNFSHGMDPIPTISRV